MVMFRYYLVLVAPALVRRTYIVRLEQCTINALRPDAVAATGADARTTLPPPPFTGPATGLPMAGPGDAAVPPTADARTVALACCQPRGGAQE